MITFLVNALTNTFKERNAKKIKLLYDFILKKKSGIYVKESDVVYALSVFSQNVSALERELRSSADLPTHGFTTFRRKEVDDSGKVVSSGSGSGSRGPAGRRWERHGEAAVASGGLPCADLRHFLYLSKAYTNNFLDIYLRRILSQENEKKKKNIICVKNCIYLLNSICTLGYDEQRDNCNKLFKRTLTRVMLIHRARCSTTYNVVNEENALNSHTVVELLTVINKNASKLKRWGVDFRLFRLFCLNLINYLFHSNVFIIGNLCENEAEKEDVPYSTPKNIVKCDLSEGKINMENVIAFYKNELMDVYNYVSIILFLKRYIGVYNIFKRESYSDIEKSCCNISPHISDVLVRIYFQAFIRDYSHKEMSKKRNDNIDIIVNLPMQNSSQFVCRFYFSGLAIMWSFFPHQFEYILKEGIAININIIIHQSVLRSNSRVSFERFGSLTGGSCSKGGGTSKERYLLYGDHPTEGHLPYGDAENQFDAIDLNMCNLTTLNRRHLFNVCTSYAKAHFYDELFIRIVEKFVDSHLLHLNSYDITAVVHFFHKIGHRNEGLLRRIMHHIVQNIEKYDLSHIHAIFIGYFKLKVFLKEGIRGIINYLLLHITVIHSLDGGGNRCAMGILQTGKSSTNQPSHNAPHRAPSHNAPHNAPSHQLTFQKIPFQSTLSNGIPFSQAGDSLENSRTALACTMSEERRLHSIFAQYSENLSQKLKVVRSILNIVNVLSKCKVGRNNSIYDKFHIYIVSNDKYSNFFSTEDWVSVISMYRVERSFFQSDLKDKRSVHFPFHREKLSELRKYGVMRRNHQLRGSFNDYIYRLLIRKFKRIKERKDASIYKEVPSAKTSYNVDLLFSCNFSISHIKAKLAEYTYELKLVDAQKFKVVYLGKRRLVRPIKKQMEAYYLTFSFEVYPSMIGQIYQKFIITRNVKKTKMIPFMEDDCIKKDLAKVEQNFFKKSV
ncbi:apicoplast ribosomal protein S6, putative (RPS6) [Plasmodium ovale wallikeri]|uniref:Apicoplast ribosomal protein S6, putative (RPS6) n=1 Tax=Plasmodium ovale wallikeri TaxID=864142 RepID=A0A1A8YV82_PLAOA|nr:apicoplast ribosomal protein S6, putative (RPS6) [Plasmodium ovale wallikeri]